MKIKATIRVWVASLIGWEGHLYGSENTVSGNSFPLLAGSPLYSLRDTLEDSWDKLGNPFCRGLSTY